jgi:hypothetical protein
MYIAYADESMQTKQQLCDVTVLRLQHRLPCGLLQVHRHTVRLPSTFVSQDTNQYFLNSNISNRLTLCEQAQPEFIIPVELYNIGGPIDFKPLDINGTLLSDCPSIPGVSPIVTDVLNCNSTSPGKPTPYPTTSVSVSIPIPTISLPNITVFPTGTGTASVGIPVRTSSDWQLKGRWSQKLGRRAKN